MVRCYGHTSLRNRKVNFNDIIDDAIDDVRKLELFVSFPSQYVPSIKDILIIKISIPEVLIK